MDWKTFVSDVTIIIPCAPYHTDLLDRAVKSANEQTIQCDVFVYEDTEMRGAGFARNKALAEVTSKFTVCLDADDQIAPAFVERCLSVWQPNRYIYTDWVQEDGVHKASDNPWQANNGEWHTITALIPTDAIKRVGGFDETVLGGEDSLFYWALTRSGICGLALHEPLFTYGKEGRRARAFVNSPQYAPTMLALIERYGDAMCCGGDNPIQSFVPDQAGDVQAYAMWGGNRRELGIITGRLYPRGGNMNTMSVDPRDVEASPEKWQRVLQPKPVQPQQPAILAHERPMARLILPPNKVLDGVGELADVVMGKQVGKVLTADDLKAQQPAMTASELKAIVRPDVNKARRLAKGKK